jgi:uncharacterized GH25 family protein
MRSMWKTWVLGLVVLCPLMTNATETLSCKAIVTDATDKPVASAQVTLYVLCVDPTGETFDIALEKTGMTDAMGKVSIEVAKPERDREVMFYGILLADKKPLALGWASIEFDDLPEGGGPPLRISLEAPGTVSGQVVNEAGVPVGQAQVSVSVMMVPNPQKEEPHFIVGQAAEALFSCQTDEQGRFSFARIPEKASMEFIFRKAGFATVSTFYEENDMTLTYHCRQDDIRITLPTEQVVTGFVRDAATGKPVKSITLRIYQERHSPFSGLESAISTKDGGFVIKGLTPGTYTIEPMFSKEQQAQWACQTVTVEIVEGQASAPVHIKLGKGGVLEVRVTVENTGKPVARASVSYRPKDGNRYSHATTNDQGIAYITLAPGIYTINAVHKQGNRSLQQNVDVAIEAGKTVVQKWELGGLPTVTGVVKDPSGAPLAEVAIKIMPAGSRETVSDANGCFEVSWDPRHWGNEEVTRCLVARHNDRNLATGWILEEETKNVDIVLEPGVTLAGRVLDPTGTPMDQAGVRVMLHLSNWGSSLDSGRIKTDASGRFEVRAIPAEHEYWITASTDGFGKQEKRIDTGDAEDGRMVLGDYTLPLADQTVTGQVVDETGKPMANARIHAYGDNQPDNRNIKTDAQGNFTIEKACVGRIRISANYSSPGQTHLYGNIETEGGATDVKLVIAQSGGRSRFVARTPKPLKGNALPDAKALGYTGPVASPPGITLVCFWDMMQRPARRCLLQLAKQAQQLDQEGVRVIAVQASSIEQDSLDAWLKEYAIPFKVCTLPEDQDKVTFKWGVTSLPWLILTDENGIVKAEGFKVGRLAETLKAMKE